MHLRISNEMPQNRHFPRVFHERTRLEHTFSMLLSPCCARAIFYCVICSTRDVKLTACCDFYGRRRHRHCRARQTYRTNWKICIRKMAREVKQMQFDCIAFALCALLFYRIQQQINNNRSEHHRHAIRKQCVESVARCSSSSSS